jgi:hypothetical protein
MTFMTPTDTSKTAPLTEQKTTTAESGQTTKITFDPMYTAVAEVFAKKIDALFTSEQTLEQKFKSLYAGLPFDRTEHWAGIIYGVCVTHGLTKGPVVKSEPTGMDKLKILKAAQDASRLQLVHTSASQPSTTRACTT